MTRETSAGGSGRRLLQAPIMLDLILTLSKDGAKNPGSSAAC